MQENGRMNWLEQVHQMKNRDICTMNSLNWRNCRRMQWNTDCRRRKG